MEHDQGGFSLDSSRKTVVKNDEERTTNRQFNMLEEKKDVNKLAEDFIKNFRKQLKLQREESFKRFQQMIYRGL